MKGQKGITLVALVITIIVMLILAGVTISIVINGGLFEQARSAEVETKNGVIKDHIIIESASASAKINTPGFAGTPYEIAKAFADEIEKVQAGVTAIDPLADATDTATSVEVTITFNKLKETDTAKTGKFVVTGDVDATTSKAVAKEALYTAPTP